MPVNDAHVYQYAPVSAGGRYIVHNCFTVDPKNGEYFRVWDDDIKKRDGLNNPIGLGSEH